MYLTLLACYMHFLHAMTSPGLQNAKRQEIKASQLALFTRHHVNLNALMRQLMMKSPQILFTATFSVDPEKWSQSGVKTATLHLQICITLQTRSKKNGFKMQDTVAACLPASNEVYP